MSDEYLTCEHSWIAKIAIPIMRCEKCGATWERGFAGSPDLIQSQAGSVITAETHEPIPVSEGELLLTPPTASEIAALQKITRVP